MNSLETNNLFLLSTEELSKLEELLDNSSHVLICCHKSPDGDAVGSSLAWASYLGQRGKEVEVVLPDAAPDFLHWLPGFQQVKRYDKAQQDVQDLFDKADLVCCLDFNTTSRTEYMQKTLDGCTAPRLVIDHHLAPDIASELTVSHPELSSTSEMVFRLICQLGGYEAMTTQCATAIYCGMMTDTGSFAYNSNSPQIYFIIGMLIEKGINKDLIYNRVYHTLSRQCLRLRSYVIYRKMKVVEKLKASYFTITKDEMARFRFKKGDAEGLVNEPLRIRGMKLSISLREDTEHPNLVLVSLRSSCGFHCEKMAREFFNGGGHEDAAGGKLFCSMEEAEQVALKAILSYKEQLA